MASICYSGKLRMQAVDINENKSDDFYDFMYEYPYDVPKIYLEGVGEDYLKKYCFNWDDDKVVMARKNFIVEYIRSNYVELLAEDENGNIVWMDGRTAPYEGCWGGKYLGEYRCAQTYSVVEYDLESLEKKTYKVIPEKTSEFDWRDVDRIMELYGEEEFCRDFTIRDRKVQHRISATSVE